MSEVEKLAKRINAALDWLSALNSRIDRLIGLVGIVLLWLLGIVLAVAALVLAIIFWRYSLPMLGLSVVLVTLHSLGWDMTREERRQQQESLNPYTGEPVNTADADADADGAATRAGLSSDAAFQAVERKCFQN